MQVPPNKSRVLYFGVFEVDLQESELRKSGVRIKLQEQPFQILTTLLERPGQTITREELQRKFWPTNTLVDVDHSLNASIKKLRDALGDDAENPCFIETLHRRGYRFIAPVNGPRPLAVEVSEPIEPVVAQPTQTNRPGIIASIKQHKWAVAAGGFATMIVLGAAVFGAYLLLHRPAPAPFQKFTITQVTNSGKAARAAISPDGRYVLTVLDDGGMESLWLRNVQTGSDTQIMTPLATHYESLTFSPDGNYVYFRKSGDPNESCCNLYRTPMLGGASRTIVSNIDSDIAFSPDGQRIVYIRGGVQETNKYSILTASLAGDNEIVLQTRSLLSDKPRYLAWSPTSNEIYHSLYSVGQGIGSVGAIDALSVRTGKSHRFVAFKNKYADEIRWSPDGRTLFVVYRQTGANWNRAQIGFIRQTGAGIEPITRDTNRYSTLTLSADGKTLATVMARSYATVYVLSKVGSGFSEPKALLSQSNEFDEWGWLNWSTDGNLLVSNTGRLFKLGADGKSQAQLLADPGAIIVKPAPCGTDYLVLTWTFHGGAIAPGIWRTNADGSSPLKLTDGNYDFYPVCSPDQKWVYYLDFVDGHICRVPLTGSGTAEPISPRGYGAIGGLSISPDGKTLAAAVAGGQTTGAPEAAASIALFDLAASSPPRMLPAKHYADDIYGNGTLRFTSDGKSVAYVSRENGADNVWVQPLDGSSGFPITDFKSERIWSFSLSPDGKSLAVLRGHYDSDVVVLQESKP